MERKTECINASIKAERNYGIEILRLITMLMIVLLHCLGHGGILQTAGVTATGIILKLLHAFCYGAVNLYALITGYVYVQAKHRWERLLELWLEVLFYSIAFSLGNLLISGGIGKKELVSAILPMTTRRYWYFSSYVCLFFLMPLLNKAIFSLDKKGHRGAIAAGFALLCGFNWVGLFFNVDIFSLSSGYSTFWLAYLYLVGAYIKLYEKDFNRNKIIYLAAYFGLSLLTWGGKYTIAALTDEALLISQSERMLYNYLSPLVTLGAVSLFLFFSKLSLRHGKQLLKVLAPCTFGVYLIHMHPFVREHLLIGCFASYAQAPWYAALGIVLGGGLAIFAACLLIDYLRRQLFRLLHVSTLCAVLTKKGKACIGKIQNR